MGASLASVVFLLKFLAGHQPLTLTFPDPVVCPHTVPHYGPGVQRGDPGTVNLPLWVGDCPVCGSSSNAGPLPTRFTFWVKKAPKARVN